MSIAGTMADRVSIIIPCYNYARFLGDAVQSVLDQGERNVEIVIVDDGSTDDTEAVSHRYGAAVRYVHQENAGLSAARNRGMRAASGDFLLFLDADDLLGPGALGRQLAFLQADPSCSVAVCRHRWFLGVSGRGRIQPARGSWRLFRTALDAHLCFLNIAPPNAFLIRRAVADAVGDFDVSLRACEDHDYWFRAALLGHAPRYDGGALVYYRRHGQSMSADVPRQLAHDRLMHQRVGAALGRHPSFPAGRRTEGLLAFTAGCLLTASRLAPSAAEHARYLVRDAGAIGLSELQCTAGEHGEAVGLVRHLYYLRALRFAGEAARAGITPAREIARCLAALAGDLGLPRSAAAWVARLPVLRLRSAGASLEAVHIARLLATRAVRSAIRGQ
ncbi:MAG: glycosyltransferase [Candidatus Schekmanbacteria bacterium]|nr:glycosyltransferase [Candidatus Schekmanbacteria bacterium]